MFPSAGHYFERSLTYFFTHFLLFSCTIKKKAVILQRNLKRKEAYMQATVKESTINEQPQPMCGLDHALADIAAGRIHHYTSLEDLIQKFE